MSFLQDILLSHMGQVLLLVGRVACAVVALLLCVAYLTYVERKIIAAIQLRRGPNVVGIFGLLQPFADAIKLLHKETIFPSRSKKALFFLAPVVTFVLSFMAWAVIPVDAGRVFANINVGILYILAVSSLSVYGLIIAGWASQSAYGLLGGLRSAAQMISYEVSLGLIMVSILLCTGSLNLTHIVEAQRGLWFVVPHFPMFVLFMVGILAETNRAPFDLPEAEAELVAGYHVEYSSMLFALFFLAEYANMLLMSALAVVLFLGGWYAPFGILESLPGYGWFLLKMACILFVFIWVRASLPRLRYDQLMQLGWKVFLPLSLVWVVLTAGFLILFDKVPQTVVAGAMG